MLPVLTLHERARFASNPPTAAILSAGLLLREFVRLADGMQIRPRFCQLVCQPCRRSVGEGVPRMLEIAVLRPDEKLAAAGKGRDE